MFGIIGIIGTSASTNEEIEPLFYRFISPPRSEHTSIGATFSQKNCLTCLVNPAATRNQRGTLQTFSDGIAVMTFGEIFNDLQPGETVEEYVHRLFTQDGVSSFAKLNGSFSLFIHDETRQKSYVVTDRLASRPVMYHVGREYVTFSPDLRSFAQTDHIPKKLNRTAIAAMLSSGFVHNDDTYLEDVKYLQGGSVLQISKGKKVTRYWDYVIQAQEDQGVEAYQSQLAPLLLQAVERRLRDRPDVTLLLSGGFDSRALLAACVELGYKLPIYSYYVDDVSGSDYRIAKTLAEMVGMPFSSLRYDPTDIWPNVRNSTLFFGGMRNRIYECLAFEELRGRFDAMLMGDQPFGWYAATPLDEYDMFSMLRIGRMANQPVWARLLSAQGYKDLAALDDEMLRRLSARSDLVDLHERMDYFRIVECMVREVLPLRLVMNSVAQVRNPWLDNDILDFVRRLPAKYRFSKSLFKTTVRNRFPALFSIPPATSSGGYRDWSLFYRILEEQPRAIQKACFEREYAVDALFDFDALTNYIQESRPSPILRAVDHLRNANNETVRGLGKKIAWRLFPPQERLSPQQVIDRIAVVRFMVGETLALK